MSDTMTDTERKKAAAAIFTAAAEGKVIEESWNCGLAWKRTDPFDRAKHVADSPEFFRIRPWSLPAPPAGKQWHRADGCTAEMLPIINGKQTRLLLEDETPQPEDEWQMSWGKWVKQAETPDLKKHDYRHRTTRPLPSKQVVMPWTFETAPCILKVRHKRDKTLTVAHLRETGFHIFGFADCVFEYVAEHFTQLDGSPCGTTEVS